MDEQEFLRILDMFPIVRPRDYHIDLDPSRDSTSRSVPDAPVNEWNDEKWTVLNEWNDEWKEEGKKEVKNGMNDANDAFWEKLKLAVENKVGAAEAERFCKNFQQIHRKLVYEELSLDAACSFINSSKLSTE